MLRILFVFAVVGCTKGSSPCPTVEALDALGSAEDHGTNSIIREACVTERWPAVLTDCLRGAKAQVAVEACLKLLEPDRRAKLHAQINAEPRDTTEDLQEKQAGAVLFEDKLAHKQPSFGSSPECAAYLETIRSTMKTVVACTSLDGLMLFGMQQEVLAKLKQLDGLEETAKPAACTAATIELRGERALHCAP